MFCLIITEGWYGDIGSLRAENYPTEELLSLILGRAMTAFKGLSKLNLKDNPDFVESWKYYNDRNRWMMNVSG